MKMVKIRYSGRQKEYLEFPAEDCKRSCKGSIHLQPGAIKEISQDEYAYIQKAYSHLSIEKFKQHEVIKVKKVQDKKAADESKAKKASKAPSKPQKASKKITKVTAKS